MRKVVTLLCVVVALALNLVAAGPNADKSSKEQATLLAAERAWTGTYQSHDMKIIDAMAAPDYVFTDEQGTYLDRAAYMKSLDSVKVDSDTLTDLQGFVYGSTGVVTGVWKGKYTADGKDASGTSRFTDTFVKHEGKWYVIASHDSRIP